MSFDIIDGWVKEKGMRIKILYWAKIISKTKAEMRSIKIIPIGRRNVVI